MPTPRIDGLDIHDVYQPLIDGGAAVPQYRLMSCKSTEGATALRKGGQDYFRWFRARGFEFRGMYHWLRSDSTMQAQVANLKRWIDGVGGLRQGEFVQLDWETTPGIANLTVAQVEEWLDLAENYWPGRIIVYASDWVPGFQTWRGRHPTYPVWYANYNTGTTASGGWAECERWGADIWQWSSTQMIPGISRRCDVNHVLNWTTLRRITNSLIVPPEPPPVVAPPRYVPTAHPSTGGKMKAVGPHRCYDSRGHVMLGPGEWRHVALHSDADGAETVAVKVTAVDSQGPGFISASGPTSEVNYIGGGGVTGQCLIVAPVRRDSSGRPAVALSVDGAPTHLIVDLQGVVRP